MIVLGCIILLVCILLLFEVPVAFAFASGAFLFALIAERDVTYLLPHAFWLIGGYALLALPLFIMTGALMGASGISERLILLVNAFVGRIKGGLGAVTVIGCALFGAISGSASSAIAAIGSVMIPRMVEAGYPRSHATALVACSSVLALLIPPSVPMIIFALTAGISVAAAFLSTVAAGLLIAAIYCWLNFLYLRKVVTIRVEPKVPLRAQACEIAVATKRAFFALLLPVVMLGGIYSGMVTPTEAAAVALVFTLPVGFFIYRGLTFKTTYAALLEAATTTGAIIIMLLALMIMSRVMVLEKIPTKLAELLLGISDNKYVILAIINVLLIIIGMLVDDVSGSILAAIILMPVIQEVGIHPIHFAAIVGTNLGLGNLTPPCAPLLYMAGGVANQQLNEYIGPALRFMLFGHLPVVLLVTYIPDLALFFPRVLLGIE